MPRQSTKVPLWCEQCQSEFLVYRCNAGRFIFCSIDCRRAYNATLTIEQALRDRSAPPDANGCILFTGPVAGGGYGNLVFRYKHHSAHRIAWELVNGPVPDGLFVCHTCDVKTCVNVAHLFLGTHQDNMDDMSQKGRHPSKLTPEQVLEIRDLCKRRAYPQRVIAQMYGVSTGAIECISRRKTWKHLPD